MATEMATLADKIKMEETPLSERWSYNNIYEALTDTASKHGANPAFSFQIKSGEQDKAETLTWNDYHGQVTQAANLFRSLGVGPNDVIAYLMPNANETIIAMIAGMTAGIVNPINPLLEAEQNGQILEETNAKVLVCLAPFPKTDVADKAAKAVKMAPSVKTILEVDLKKYLGPPLSWIIPLVRPKVDRSHGVTVKSFNAEMAKQPKTLSFANEDKPETICAYFHTGGTTGCQRSPSTISRASCIMAGSAQKSW